MKIGIHFPSLSFFWQKICFLLGEVKENMTQDVTAFALLLLIKQKKKSVLLRRHPISLQCIACKSFNSSYVVSGKILLDILVTVLLILSREQSTICKNVP